MIFNDHGLVQVEEAAEVLRFTHAQNLDCLRKELETRIKYQTGEGWSEGRTMRYIGTIPAAAIEASPELRAALNSADEVAIKKAVEIYFKGDGREFMVNPINTGRSGKVIIK